MNVSGEVVATGIRDPTNMFLIIGLIICIGLIIGIGYSIYQMFT